MKIYKLLFTVLFSIPIFSFAQTTQVQNASIPKDAPVDVTITDFKDNPLPNEIMVFRSKKYDREYQGQTN